MASSRDSLNQPDVTDVISALHALEKSENLRLRVCVETKMTGVSEDLYLTLEARPASLWSMAAAPWECVSVSFLATNRKNLSAALLALLYQLDFKLAARSHHSVPTK